MLLKAVFLANSQGIISSRSIERACRDNVLFIAITGDAKPHLTTRLIQIRAYRHKNCAITLRFTHALCINAPENTQAPATACTGAAAKKLFP